MSPPPLCSVVIPVYNRRDTLARAVRSVFQQSVRGIEILVVDDGSEDGSAEVAEALEVPAGVTLEVIRRSQRGGAGPARNAGIDAACGDYLAFLDSDDQWEPTKLEVQIHQLEENPRAVSLTGFLRHQGATVRRGAPGVLHESDRLAALLGSSGGPLTCSIMAVDRLVAKEEGLRFDERFPALEDLDFALCATLRGLDFVGVDDALVHKYRDPYREHLFNPGTEVVGRRLLLEKYSDIFDRDEKLRRIQCRKLVLALRHAQSSPGPDGSAHADTGSAPVPSDEVVALLERPSASRWDGAIRRAYSLHPRAGDLLLRAGANEDRVEEFWRWMLRRFSEILRDRRASRRQR